MLLNPSIPAADTARRSTSAVPATVTEPAHGEAVASTSTRRWLIAICVIAFVLRIAAIIALRAWTVPSAMEHSTLATSLVEGKGFFFYDWGMPQSSSVQSPLFPMLLAGFFLVFGTGSTAAYVGVMVINALLGAISCALTYAVVRRLGGSARVGLVAAALVAVWPTQIYSTTVVQAIAFITCCSLAVMWLFYLSVDTRRLGPWVAYGLIGCLGALTEPVLLPFMALSGLLILGWPGLPGAIRVRNAVVLFLCAMVVLAPWTYRNYLVHGQLMPVKSTFWVNMWKANNPNATGTDRVAMSDEQLALLKRDMTDAQLRDPTFDARRQYDLLTPEQRMRLTGKREVERERIFGEFAKTFIREHPQRYLELCGIRFWKTVWIESDNPKAHGLKRYVTYWIPRTLLLVLTPIALVIAWRRGWRMFVPLLVVGTALLTYTLTIAAARFALPYEPWQLALISLPLVGCWDRLRGTKTVTGTTATGAPASEATA